MISSDNSTPTHGSGVHCQRCGTGIVVQVTSNLLALEFAVTCGSCWHRGVYRRDAVTAISERLKPGRADGFRPFTE